MQKSKFQFKIQKLIKFGVLVGVKEGYLFTKNLFGLYEHPLLTTRRIVKEKDYSQGILVFGLPVYLWIGWVFILLISRFFILGRLHFGFWAKASFLASSLFSFILFFFLIYCLFILFWKGRVR